ncbi:MAG: ABC transporter substrate-binding protein [Bacteroidota bacterium]
MEKLILALDWTPNINHIGFFVAREKGFYEKHGLNVEIIDPSIDNYAITPAKKVEIGVADFALCPTESIISYRTKEKPFGLKGIATIFKEDISAIAVRTDKEIHSPRDLDGKRYASYKARYEDAIVKQMIRNDGGEGTIGIAYPEKLGIWDTLLDGNFDATWIFLNWEGVEAEALEAPLTYFKMADYQVPYSYSPMIAANEEKISDRKAEYTKFLAATRQGVAFCHDNPKEAAGLLKPFVPEKDSKIELEKALALSLAHFGTSENWGFMDAKTINRFLEWIYDHGLESKKLEATDLFTNELMEHPTL